jgi:hypothetical protein
MGDFAGDYYKEALPVEMADKTVWAMKVASETGGLHVMLSVPHLSSRLADASADYANDGCGANGSVTAARVRMQAFRVYTQMMMRMVVVMTMMISSVEILTGLHVALCRERRD